MATVILLVASLDGLTCGNYFFSAVGNAFAVLSDAEKKKQYDLYGPEEASSPSHHRNSYSHHDFTRGYESKFRASVYFVVTRTFNVFR